MNIGNMRPEHRVPADMKEQHHGHTSTRAERSWRWLADVLEACGDCVELVTIWSQRRAPDTNRAAVFWTDCSRFNWLSARVLGCQKYKWRLNPVWHRMLYSCTHMATVGVKWLNMQPQHKTCVLCSSSPLILFSGNMYSPYQHNSIYAVQWIMTTHCSI